MIRGIRGAITVDRNTEEAITSATEELLTKIINHNDINPDLVSSVFISTTEDINASFPAKALRNIDGWTYVPVMCMREIDVPNSLKMCVRIMIHVETDLLPQEINHIYLKDAKVLRPELNRQK